MDEEAGREVKKEKKIELAESERAFMRLPRHRHNDLKAPLGQSMLLER
jgi:hypothetical protein